MEDSSFSASAIKVVDNTGYKPTLLPDYVLLGMVDDYLDRSADRRDDAAEHFYPNEKAIAQLFVRYALALEPSIPALSALNPPGLNKRGPAPWLDLRTDGPFPTGLISGCFEAKSAISEEANCNYGPAKSPRVKHLALNKDKGRIDPSIGEGATERGRLNDNFKNAVEAAVADSKDKWETLKEQLILTYGPSRGTRMICALTRDKPKNSC